MHSPESQLRQASACVNLPPQVRRREAPHSDPIVFVRFKDFCCWWDSGGECKRELEPWFRREPSLPLPAGRNPLWVTPRFPLPRGTGWDGEGAINEAGIRTL